MFTGIITNLGKIESLENSKNNDLLLKISTNKNQIVRNLDIGCSIAINGICLTLIEKKIIKNNFILSFQASSETIKKTTLKNWKKSQIVNLEFALRIGDELGGHMVLGHIDGIIKIKNITKIKDSHKFTFLPPKEFLKFIVQKGSVTLDGVSLTINDVDDNYFSVNIINHTIQNTIFKNLKIGDFLNLEIDAMARYAKKILKNK